MRPCPQTGLACVRRGELLRGDQHLLADAAIFDIADRPRRAAELWDAPRAALVSAFFLNLFDGSAAARLLSAALGDPRAIAATVRERNASAGSRAAPAGF